MNSSFREEATSALVSFRAGPPSWLNWNYLEMLVFVGAGGGEPEYSD